MKLNHEEVSWEYYTGHCFVVQELIPGVDRHHGTRVKMNALGGEFTWTLNHEIIDKQTRKEGLFLSVLLEEMCHWHNRGPQANMNGSFLVRSSVA